MKLPEMRRTDRATGLAQLSDSELIDSDLNKRVAIAGAGRRSLLQAGALVGAWRRRWALGRCSRPSSCGMNARIAADEGDGGSDAAAHAADLAPLAGAKP